MRKALRSSVFVASGPTPRISKGSPSKPLRRGVSGGWCAQRVGGRTKAVAPASSARMRAICLFGALTKRRRVRRKTSQRRRARFFLQAGRPRSAGRGCRRLCFTAAMEYSCWKFRNVSTGPQERSRGLKASFAELCLFASVLQDASFARGPRSSTISPRPQAPERAPAKRTHSRTRSDGRAPALRPAAARDPIDFYIRPEPQKRAREPSKRQPWPMSTP